LAQTNLQGVQVLALQVMVASTSLKTCSRPAQRRRAKE
jgi:hypothetical protein